MSSIVEPVANRGKLPPLENGDRLSRAEFYRRWEAMPRIKHAERIEGVVYMQAAARYEGHGRPNLRLGALLIDYEIHTPGVESGENATVQADDDNDPQPDLCLFVLPERGGQCRVTPDDYLEGAPEFIGEIAASSASRDLHQKLDLYERVGVREYLVWKTLEDEIVWHRHASGRLTVVPPDGDGVYRSTVFPGLWIDAQALIQGRMADAFATLRVGLQTPEHAAFAQQLADHRA
jgi:Uma2 family endonuclease